MAHAILQDSFDDEADEDAELKNHENGKKVKKDKEKKKNKKKKKKDEKKKEKKKKKREVAFHVLRLFLRTLLDSSVTATLSLNEVCFFTGRGWKSCWGQKAEKEVEIVIGSSPMLVTDRILYQEIPRRF